MGWSRFHHRRTVKPVRHAWASLGVPHCQDCGNELPTTHQFSRFESRCFSCWSVFSHVLARFSSSDDGSSHMASQ